MGSPPPNSKQTGVVRCIYDLRDSQDGWESPMFYVEASWPIGVNPFNWLSNDSSSTAATSAARDDDALGLSARDDTELFLSDEEEAEERSDPILPIKMRPSLKEAAVEKLRKSSWWRSCVLRSWHS